MRFVPLIVVVALLFATALQSEAVPQWFAHQDKLHHVLGFGALAVALHLAFPRLFVVEYVLILLTSAIAIELGQSLVPPRLPSMLDLFASGVGAALGLLCVEFLKRRAAPADPRATARTTVNPHR